MSKEVKKDDNDDWEDLDAIDEEYDTWKSNLDQMYGMVFEKDFSEESFMTFQWLPESKTSDGDGVTTQKMIYGTLEQEENRLYVGEITAQFQGKKTQSSLQSSIFNTVNSIPHEGDVNRARYNPQKPSVVATSNESGLIQLFDIVRGERLRSLKKHENNAFGLSWSSDNHLLTACDDGKIVLWNTGIEGDTSEKSIVKEYQASNPEKGTNESIGINDITYQWQNGTTTNTIGAISEAGFVHFYDIRQEAATNVLKAHEEPANSISFNPHSQYLYATACNDASIGVWDLRFPNTRLHSLLGHSNSVQSLEWSPFYSQILMSGSDDRRILLWDISRIGQEQSPEDIEDGAPEVLFMHGGHKHSVHDVSWNPEHKWVVGSVAGDLSFQLWRPLDQIVDSVDISVRDSQLE